MVRAIVEANIGNEQLTAEEAETVTRVLTSAKNIIATKISRIDPVFVIHRTLKNKNVEIYCKLMYDKQTAVGVAKTAIREAMREDLKQLQGKLDRMLELE
jgi:predicted transcriptional regulator